MMFAQIESDSQPDYADFQLSIEESKEFNDPCCLVELPAYGYLFVDRDGKLEVAEGLATIKYYVAQDLPRPRSGDRVRVIEVFYCIKDAIEKRNWENLCHDYTSFDVFTKDEDGDWWRVNSDGKPIELLQFCGEEDC